MESIREGLLSGRLDSPARRSFLRRASAGLAIGLTGCSSTDDADTPAEDTPTESSPTPGPDPRTADPSQTATPSATRVNDGADGGETVLAPGEAATTDRGETVTVANARVQRSVMTLCQNPGNPRVVAPDGAQFLVVDVTLDGPDRGARLAEKGPTLSIERDGERVTVDGPCETVFAGITRSWRADRVTVALPVPIAETERAAVVWGRDGTPVRWLLPDGVVEAFGAAPTFAVRDFRVPAEIGHFEDIPVALTVANDGDRDGTFRATLELANPFFENGVRFAVPAGEAVTHRTSRSHPVKEGVVTLECAWGTGALSRRVRLVWRDGTERQRY